ATVKKLDGYDLGLRENNAQTRAHVLAMLEKALKPYSRPNDVVLVLAHVGFDPKRAEESARKHLLTGKDLTGVANVDFVLDGHTHRIVGPERMGDAWYVQGGRYLKRFTEITLKVDKDGTLSRDIDLRSYGDTESITPSAEVARAIADIRRQHGFGNVLFDLTGPDKDFYLSSDLRWRSKPLGTLFAAAMHKSIGADFAVITASGFKGELYPRPLTVGHAYDVTPLAGNILSAKIKGSKVYELFSRFLVPGTGSFPQIHGIAVKVRQDEDNPRKPYRVLSITLADGKALDPDKEYTIAYNGRLFSKPEDESLFMSGSRVHGTVSEMVVEYFEQNRKLPWSAIAAEECLQIQKGQ
ncbi:5'-nucleotidase C-terminal domain-containing protein, partial [Desulfovibrio sp. OttesenSCG-928-G15]|nr:5'-nucleotidase C-terminal domain-containing protein [Desulfovibrio sp. OttesenSCG-928-G15]